MNKKRNHARAIVLAGAMMSAVALPATANDWKAWEGQDESSPRAVYTAGTDSPPALLTCGADGKLSAMISLKPASLPELLAKNAPYSRAEKASVMVGAAEAAETKVKFVPAIDVIEMHSHSISAKVFNAAVKGEPLKISVTRAGDIETVLPEPNDAFKAFARTCNESREASTRS